MFAFHPRNPTPAPVTESSAFSRWHLPLSCYSAFSFPPPHVTCEGSRSPLFPPVRFGADRDRPGGEELRPGVVVGGGRGPKPPRIIFSFSVSLASPRPRVLFQHREEEKRSLFLLLSRKRPILSPALEEREPVPAAQFYSWCLPRAAEQRSTFQRSAANARRPLRVPRLLWLPAEEKAAALNSRERKEKKEGEQLRDCRP